LKKRTKKLFIHLHPVQTISKWMKVFLLLFLQKKKNLA